VSDHRPIGECRHGDRADECAACLRTELARMMRLHYLGVGEVDGLRAKVRALEEERDFLRTDNHQLRKQILGHCERIAKQSELLSRRAEGIK
jgi:regulator of replication initiation timing